MLLSYTAASSRTLCAFSNTILDTDNAVLELLLRNTKVLVRVGQVLDLFIELLLDLRKLLDAQRVQVDYAKMYQHVIQRDNTATTATMFMD